MLVKSQTVFSKNNVEERDIRLENVLFSVTDCLANLKQPVYSDDKKEYIGNLFLDVTRKVTKEDLEEGTCVFFVRSFLNANKERFENLKQAEMHQEGQIIDDYIFYMQKYNIYLNFEQFCAFTQNKLDEKFIIVDGDNAVDRLWVFIDSAPHEVTQTFYSINFLSGKFVKEAIQKSTSTYNWGDMQLLKPKDGRVCDFGEVESGYRYYYGNIDADQKKLIVSDSNQQYAVKHFDIVNARSGTKMNREQILKVFLNIPGSTRIATFINGYGFNWRICNTEMNNSNANIRFGLKLPGEDRGYYRDPFNDVYLYDVFPDSKIEDEVKEKVYNKLKQDLINDVNCHLSYLKTSEYGGSTDIPYFSKDMVIVTKPVPGHRRPTYHLITGFMVRGEIEIVELARGELQMKDMTPVSTYFLLSGEDKYVRIGRRYYSQIKEAVTHAEVDKSSIEDWAEEKAQHPELLKAISQKANQEKFNLEVVKTFNRIPFGSLLLEQLIKIGYDDLSIRIAGYILTVADNMNYNISSLGDMLPGCNPEGSNLLSIFNLTKPCYELLMKDVNKIVEINDFFIKYKVIKQFIPDGIITKERAKLISAYFELYNNRQTNYYITGGQYVDILKYPEMIKSIYKMNNKINIAFKNTRFAYDAAREYDEIVKAYLSFKELNMDPEEYKIFIEFGLGDTSSPEQSYAELHSREVAANTGLKICENKINEKIHKEKENKYSFRKNHALKKLTTLKASEQKQLGNYVIIAPSQIYGERTVGSIEKEGHDMCHCVYRSYANDIAEGAYTVLYLRKKTEPDKSLVTIGINSDGRINQTYAYNDGHISSELAAVINKWAEFKKDYVTFKSEHDSVRPGGWPSGCGVLDLPKPSKEWLRELARVK